MATGTLITLALYFLLMLIIGVYAYRQANTDIEGYMLGGRSLGPSVTALSAGASDMSGWMLMGVPGAMYVSGMSSSWIVLGLTLGAYLNYLIVAPRLRTFTEFSHNSLTLPDYLENRFADKSKILRWVSSLVIIIFFTLYTSSGLVAGGKLFESAFNLNYDIGLYVTAGIVVLYTMVGGFLAVSLTDFVQGCIMLLALVLVPIVVLEQLGGVDQSLSIIENIDAAHLDIFNQMTIAGIISAMAWGLGYFGQPHIIVRFMAIRSVKDLPVARNIGMAWMILALLGAMFTGFLGIAYVQQHDVQLADPETIFVIFSQLLFHPLIGGFLLAAILAAIMSTLSSQLLVTSSSLTQDIYQTFLHKKASDKQLIIVGRVCVLLVALCAGSLARQPDNSILNLVGNAWAGFGATFGPVIILSLYWKRMTAFGALAGMVTGAATVLFWIYAPLTFYGQSLSQLMYEIVPGFVVATVTIVVVSLIPSTRKYQETQNEVQEEFEKMVVDCKELMSKT